MIYHHCIFHSLTFEAFWNVEGMTEQGGMEAVLERLKKIAPNYLSIWYHSAHSEVIQLSQCHSYPTDYSAKLFSIILEWRSNEQNWPLNERIGCCLYIEATPDSFISTSFDPFMSHLASSVSLLSIPLMNPHWMMFKWIGMTSEWTNQVLSLYRDNTRFVHSDPIPAHSWDIQYFKYQS